LAKHQQSRKARLKKFFVCVFGKAELLHSRPCRSLCHSQIQEEMKRWVGKSLAGREFQV